MSWARDYKVANSKADPAWCLTRPSRATEANLQTFISSNLLEREVGTRGAGVDGTRVGSEQWKAK